MSTDPLTQCHNRGYHEYDQGGFCLNCQQHESMNTIKSRYVVTDRLPENVAGMACSSTAQWFHSLYQLAMEAEEERKAYEAHAIESGIYPKYKKLNYAIAQLSGYARSAKGILTENDIEV